MPNTWVCGEVGVENRISPFIIQTNWIALNGRQNVIQKKKDGHTEIKGPTTNKKGNQQKDTCTHMFIAALFIIAKTWRQPKYPSTDEWIKKMWYLYTMEY